MHGFLVTQYYFIRATFCVCYFQLNNWKQFLSAKETYARRSYISSDAQLPDISQVITFMQFICWTANLTY